MSNKTQTCPVCGVIVDADETFCPSCGERLTPEDTEQPEAVTPDYVDRSVTTGGGRNNIMGDNVVNAQDQSTTNNIDNSQTTNTVNNVQNTSSTVNNQQTVGSIDNSQQVVNHITIIGGGSGMNLPGGISIPGGAPQVENSAPVAHNAAPREHSVQTETPAAKTGGYAVPVVTSGGTSRLWSYLAVAAIAIAAFVYFRGGSDEKQTIEEETEVVSQEEAPVQQVAPARSAAPRAAATPVSSASVEEAPQPQAAASDANYEAGMAAYNSGDGLEAVRKFQDSGSPQSLYMLGVIYEKGCGGVEANAMKARSFFKKAATQGHSDAKSKL